MQDKIFDWYSQIFKDPFRAYAFNIIPCIHLYNNILYFIPIVLILFFLLFKLYSNWNCVCVCVCVCVWYEVWLNIFFSLEDQLSLYHLLNNASFPPLIVQPTLY